MYDEKRDLIATYRSTVDILGALIGDVSDADAAVPPAAKDGWSVAEVVCHLFDSEQRTYERVIRIRDEDWPSLPLFPDDDYGGRLTAHVFAAFASLRKEHVRLLDDLDAATWSRTGAHEIEGDVSILDLTRHGTAHDSEHLAQIARRLSHGGLPPR